MANILYALAVYFLRCINKCILFVILLVSMLGGKNTLALIDDELLFLGTYFKTSIIKISLSRGHLVVEFPVVLISTTR